MKIHNLTSPRSGRAVANQFVGYDDHMTIFQSYDSTIAMIEGNSRRILIGKDWDYSVTTAKWFYQFMRDYAPAVNFEWNRNAIHKAINEGGFWDCFNRFWAVRYDPEMV